MEPILQDLSAPQFFVQESKQARNIAIFHFLEMSLSQNFLTGRYSTGLQSLN